MRSPRLVPLLMLLPVLLAAHCKKATPPTPAAAPATAPTAAKLTASLDRPETLAETAPDLFKAKFSTNKGDIVIEVHRDWAPVGADRFYNLVKQGFYNETRFFRVIKDFMAQIGISGVPALNTVWREARIKDDPVKQSNKRGYVSFATAGANTRTTQFFINYSDMNARLDPMGFAPFGQVVSGMDVVDALNGQYGEGPPMGQGPNQMRLQNEGNPYLAADFPALDYVKTATIVP
jgi:peptidyl-prolyl cis-trans isomerase A (cyclophilin A)